MGTKGPAPGGEIVADVGRGGGHGRSLVFVRTITFLAAAS